MSRRWTALCALALVGCGGEAFSAGDALRRSDDAGDEASTELDAALDSAAGKSDADSGATMQDDAGSVGRDAGHEASQDAADTGCETPWSCGYPNNGLGAVISVHGPGSMCLLYPEGSGSGAFESGLQLNTPAQCQSCGAYDCACVTAAFDAGAVAPCGYGVSIKSCTEAQGGPAIRCP